MQIDIFPDMHQDKNKKEGHLTILEKEWKIKMKSCDKSRCQCGHVCILLCLHQLPGEALTSW